MPRAPPARVISAWARVDRTLGVLSLAETRRFLREAHARMMAVFFAVLYALGTMVLGGMLIIARVPGGYTTEILWGNALGTGSWNYPGLLLVAPWGVVSLPFLATLAMVIVSAGVGIGVSVAIVIVVRLLRDRREAGAGAGTVGTIAGLTPAMIALVTLGACCSTTAVATAGVGLVAQASGSSLNNLLVNNWYLDVFQVSIVYVALIAQELILRVYGGLLGLTPASVLAAGSTPATAPHPRPSLAIAALRAALLLAGLTWSLAMFAEWAGPSPPLGSGALWFQWVMQHQLVGDFAVAVALFPGAILGPLRRAASAPRAFRGALLVAGLSLVAWTPPAIARAGAPGFLNELFGVAGLPAAWGAVSPVFGLSLALVARWAFQYMLLGAFALAVAVAPSGVAKAVAFEETGELAPTRSGSVDGWSPGPPTRRGTAGALARRP
jgi:hypothetical protein